MVETRRIDVHTHILPPRYRKWLMDQGADAGGMQLPEWSVEQALAHMEECRIGLSIVSVSTPGVDLAPAESAASVARDLNDYAADLVRTHPGRFGFFATLPLCDIDGAVREADRALTQLQADGIVLPAHCEGAYLGDPLFEPLLEELNRKTAVVFVHPSELTGDAPDDLPAFAADFLLDTVRAAVKLARSGALDAFPDVRYILPNAGGFLPYAAGRLAAVSSPNNDAEDGLRLLKSFYFETALGSTKYSLPCLLGFADPGRVIFGSDFPYAPAQVGEIFSAELEAYDPANLQAIERGNAERLFSRPRPTARSGTAHNDLRYTASGEQATCRKDIATPD